MERAMKAKRRLEGRKERIRAKVSGTAERPLVSVHFSNRSIVAQMIDDTSGRTLAAVSTQGKNKIHSLQSLAGRTGRHPPCPNPMLSQPPPDTRNPSPHLGFLPVARDGESL